MTTGALDVANGAARLQSLMATLVETHGVPAFGDLRRVLTATMAGEQHRFGLAMVEKFLFIAGWHVHSEAVSTPESLAALVRREWFAIVAINLGCESRLDAVASAIQSIRTCSCNKAIGVIVGGPAFVHQPEYVRRVGADATAVDAPTAVRLAQKLLDIALDRRFEAWPWLNEHFSLQPDGIGA